jgi:hypothetical protein
MSATATFHESRLASIPIRDLGLAIAGTPLAAVVEEFLAEVKRLGLAVEPRPYLSTEWGVPFGTVAIAIPFYLARPELTALHAERTGFVEGVDRRDILRYLRHELGHVVNYAYRLYEREDWVASFGAITQPYRERYQPRPFSRSYVRHLPGWYAQKHPDEDWAETFAVWMTPGRDWRLDYAGWPGALAKLDLCDRLLAELRDQPPAVTAADLDEDVGELGYSISDFYGEPERADGELLPGLDGALHTLFDDAEERAAGQERSAAEARRPAAELLRRLGRELPPEVFRWTGHFPEDTARLVTALADRAVALGLDYPAAREAQLARETAVLVAALAMSHVQNGSYLA